MPSCMMLWACDGCNANHDTCNADLCCLLSLTNPVWISATFNAAIVQEVPVKEQMNDAC